jgi:hypothetical protein
VWLGLGHCNNGSVYEMKAWLAIFGFDHKPSLKLASHA